MNPIKEQLLNLFIKFLSHESVQLALNQAYQLRSVKNKIEKNSPSPYFEFDETSQAVPHGTGSVFITSRFRTGSTVLWNIFRNIDDCTAYYEPFNERRWFNSQSRGDLVDSTHLGVKDYWKEYEGMDDLDSLYNEDWIRESLMMDEASWNPRMKDFIDELINSANGTPVLQFNRIDFRLPWLKHTYPGAKIIHLYRHPRDQWFSFLTDKSLMNKDDVHKTYIDGFYLDSWCNDLQKFFPFLSNKISPHPYQRFYYLWKLSFLYGQQFSDISISFENMTQEPEETLNQIFSTLNWQNNDWKPALSVLKKTKLDKWKAYAEEEWFHDFEAQCEETLTQFLTAQTIK